MTKGIGRKFIRGTQYPYMEDPDQNKGVPQPPLVLDYDETKPRIDLPAPTALEVPNLDLRALITNRCSVRAYAQEPLTLAELSYLLWCTQGIKEMTARPATLRTVPSGGSRHPFETYLLANNIQGLQPGLYRFLPVEHQLAEFDLEPGIADKVTEVCLQQSQVRTSAVTFIWVAVVYRTTWRYSERGYRYMLIDAGHICQNLYLAGESIGCGVCAIGAFQDEEINSLFGLDGEEQFAVYAASVGKKKR